ncbi:MAG: AIPR family protein [Burkholderiaceae bacterium]|nr:AIPR family protein [Burkholderiaceae bacterium]
MTKPWETAFSARTDLEAYGDNALGLFALGLRFNIEDLDTVAADSITDGSDDKKCDIVHIDEVENFAVITQCYKSIKAKPSAPANKASDLNTAVAWLLQRPLKDLPERILSAAKQLRSGIESGDIKKIYIWYVHNLPESENVSEELSTVEETAKSALLTRFPGKSVAISATEVGQTAIDTLYSETLSPILVNDEFDLVVQNGFEVTGPKWAAYVTSFPAQFLHKIYKKHKTKLFSANVRDYLGSRSSDSNINNGIKKTAETEPENFWVFNNGLTILVNNYEAISGGLRSSRTRLKISGMSIVNGAQTTGALASLAKAPTNSLLVSARFVKTSDSDLIHSIIQFNNSQNKVTASDFRSTDSVQKRLKEQMARIPGAEYEGGRRGGSGDSIARRPNLLPSYTVGQSLAALHGDPVTAYNQKTNIWINDRLYSKYFNEDTTANHIVFAFGLLRTIEHRKLALMTKAKHSPASLTSTEEKQLSFFRKRGSIYLLVSAIASCLETFLGRKIPNIYRLSFGDRCSPKDAQKYWADIVDVTAALCTQLDEALNDGLKSLERATSAIGKFQALVEVTSQANSSKFKSFRMKIVTK